ncbi:fatty-acid amide hydrolase 1 [Elysia marginata]|uniref:Fatty-acid amide hydrolase 1 n=1 Tax=Elysia marginata TaxID=1093978 RepID=A0AAV4JM06_9GAST|nr:fatty-acid amide hydrolase 1 [Elysia marginata]
MDTTEEFLPYSSKNTTDSYNINFAIHLKQQTNFQEFRQTFHSRWRHARLDALLCPVFPCAAVNLANEGRFLACLTHVGLFSLLNYPAGTVPVTRVHDSDLSQFHTSKFRATTPLEELMMQYCFLLFVVYGSIRQDQVGDEVTHEGSAVGLPIGVQVAALPFQEEVVLRVMMELERGRQMPSFSEQGGRRSASLGMESGLTESSNVSESEVQSEYSSDPPKLSDNGLDQDKQFERLSESEDGQPDSSNTPHYQNSGEREDTEHQDSNGHTMATEAKSPRRHVTISEPHEEIHAENVTEPARMKRFEHNSNLKELPFPSEMNSEPKRQVEMLPKTERTSKRRTSKFSGRETISKAEKLQSRNVVNDEDDEELFVDVEFTYP